MINRNSAQGQELLQNFQWFKHTPEGQMVLEYLQGMFLYPNNQLSSMNDNVEPSNDEKIGHHRVVLHIMSMMDQVD